MHKFSFFLTRSVQTTKIRYKNLLKDNLSGTYLQCFAELFYPKICIECNRSLWEDEKVLCHVCNSDLPRCEFSFYPDNRAEALFKGRVEIQLVSSLLYFKKKGMVQRMMHALKYQGREDVGRYIGSMLGAEIRKSKRFASVDLILPVPLHPKKKRARGYNQVSEFAHCLSELLEVPVLEDALLRKKSGRSQTQKSRIARNRSLEDSFVIRDFKVLINKHILVVDDIITSGATMEMCARRILEVQGTRVSLASMAFTL